MVEGQDNPTLIQPEGPVLSTLDADGSRRWLRPRLSKGRFLTRRRAVAYLLIAVFNLIPWLKVGGKPLVLIDVADRQLIFLGKTFLVTDTFLLALGLIGIFVTIFLITALFGRVWCGWACPQTVYMEFLYRPIERLFAGRTGVGGKPRKTGPLRTLGMYATFLVVSFILAHTFLSYFVGVEELYGWVGKSPADHPITFTLILVVTGLMMFDFAIFREQLCIIACPYGRFQSALLDAKSLIISYDPKRGEPRGKLKRAAGNQADTPLPVLQNATQGQGDCIDCHMCVTTCPTGIDIRKGLQLECIGCAQCIDACDTVMDRIGKPQGLIRYTSQEALDTGAAKLFRPRIIIYPAILLAVATLFLVTLGGTGGVDTLLLRNRGLPFVMRSTGEVENAMRIELTNRTGEPQTYTLAVAAGSPVYLSEDFEPVTLGPTQGETYPFRLVAPPELFLGDGTHDLELVITNAAGNTKTIPCRMLGPATQQ